MRNGPGTAPTALDVQQLFEALGDRTRIRIVNLLSAGEICVCYFVAVLCEPQPKISRHLAYLRRAGVVSARRDGKGSHYSLRTPEQEGLAALLRGIVGTLRELPEMKRDLAHLTRACCATSLPPELRDAPRPRLDGDGD
jgi:ArsR family transcriptional regulator, arsenate/arsenite/antimonite-responsive transcriptional repressor